VIRHVGRNTRLLAILVLSAALALASCTSSGRKASAPNNSASTAPTTTIPAGNGPAVASPGCGTSKVRALEKDDRTIQVDGQSREYLLTTPPAHDGKTPLPLVLDFHGLAEGAQIHTLMSNFGALAKKDGFVVAFPQGQGQPVQWNLSAPPKPHPDLDFVDQLLDRLGNDLCIDTSRVYASGLSFGAFMSSFLACERPNKFAAVAPVAGVTVFPGCEKKQPIPVIAFHGTGDPILRFNGGVGAIPGITSPAPVEGATTTTVPAADLNGAGYPKNVATWAKRNGCDPKPTDTKVASDVIHRVYHCPAGQDVEFYIIIGGGHAWPGSKFSQQIASVIGRTSMNIDATKLMWKFFQRFQLHDASSTTNSGS
jgi:polyhydroxybutyrate depolymerase